MKWKHPSPSLVISLIALFVALGGTSLAAINALPKNSVGTAQIKNGAVTPAKLTYGGTLPSKKTEVGDWGFGTLGDANAGGSEAWSTVTFPIPLAHGFDGSHRVYVSGSSATHCPGVGQADSGYLCVYQGRIYNALTPTSNNIFDPEDTNFAVGPHGFGIFLHVISSPNEWMVSGTYAVTAP